MTKKIPLETFIKTAHQAHNNRYDYSQSVYNGYNNEIEINCPDHGMFKQTPHKHIKGSGCESCNIKDDKTDKFIKECNIIHKNKYDYSETIYKASKLKVKINCPIHNEFEQLAKNHKSGQGCPKCRTSSSKLVFDKKIKPGLELFIHKAKLVYGDKFDYTR